MEVQNIYQQYQELELANDLFEKCKEIFMVDISASNQKEQLESMYQALEIVRSVHLKEQNKDKKDQIKVVLEQRIDELAVYNAQYEANQSMIRERKEKQMQDEINIKLNEQEIKKLQNDQQGQQGQKAVNIAKKDEKKMDLRQNNNLNNKNNNQRNNSSDKIKQPARKHGNSVQVNQNVPNKKVEEKKVNNHQPKPSIPKGEKKVEERKEQQQGNQQQPKKQFLQKGKAQQNKPQVKPPEKERKEPPIKFDDMKSLKFFKLKNKFLLNFIMVLYIILNFNALHIAGLKNAKGALKQAVILPLQHPEIFVGNRKPWKGILLYGPPGTGKTLLAKACAGEIGAKFFGISSADITSKWLGETEKNIKQIFEDARKQKPSIVFVDECEALFGARKENSQEHTLRALSEFLQQMQGVGNNNDRVLVFAATNLPFNIDSAIRRRFEKRIYIPLPDFEARNSLLTRSLQKDHHSLTEQQIANIANQLDGYSCSDIDVVIKGAAMQPLMMLDKINQFKIIQQDDKAKFVPVREQSIIAPGQQIIEGGISKIQGEIQLPPISYDDFMHSIKQNKPSVSKDQLEQYEKFTAEFGMDG